MKRLFSVAGALALAAMLAGCAGDKGAELNGEALETGLDTARGKVAEINAKVATFTIEDAQLALDDANAHQDIIAATCYQHIIEILPALQAGETTAAPKGLLSGFQRARDLVKLGQRGFSQEFTLKCAPLYVDARADVKELAGGLAGLAAKIGLKGFLPVPF